MSLGELADWLVLTCHSVSLIIDGALCSDPGISHGLSEAEEQLHTALRSPLCAQALAASQWPGQDSWPLTTVPSSPPGHQLTPGTGHQNSTCVTVTGDWGEEGVRNEIIIDVITISRVNLATWINNSELLNWGEAILKAEQVKLMTIVGMFEYFNDQWRQY